MAGFFGRFSFTPLRLIAISHLAICSAQCTVQFQSSRKDVHWSVLWLITDCRFSDDQYSMKYRSHRKTSRVRDAAKSRADFRLRWRCNLVVTLGDKCSGVYEARILKKSSAPFLACNPN